MQPPPHPTDVVAHNAAMPDVRTPTLCALGALTLAVGAPAFCLLAGFAVVTHAPLLFFLAFWLALASFLVGQWSICAALWPRQPSA